MRTPQVSQQSLMLLLQFIVAFHCHIIDYRIQMGYNLQLNRMTDTVCYQYITVILISDPQTVLLYLIQCFSTFLLKQILPQMYTLQKEP